MPLSAIGEGDVVLVGWGVFPICSCDPVVMSSWLVIFQPDDIWSSSVLELSS